MTHEAILCVHESGFPDHAPLEGVLLGGEVGNKGGGSQRRTGEVFLPGPWISCSVKLGLQLLLYELGHRKTSLTVGQEAKGSASGSHARAVCVQRQ